MSIFLHIGFKRVVGIAIVIVPGWDLRKEVVFFTGWGMYFGWRPFFNIPEAEVFQYLFDYKPIDFTQQEISNYMILMDNIQNMFSMVIEEQFSFKIDDLRVYLVELCH